MQRYSARDWHEPPERPVVIFAMRPIPPAVLMGERLRTRALYGDAYEVASYLIASADWWLDDGLDCGGAMPLLADIATVTELPVWRCRAALDWLVRSGIVERDPPSYVAPTGSYGLRLRVAPVQTTETIEGMRQLEGPTIVPSWVDQALGRDS